MGTLVVKLLVTYTLYSAILTSCESSMNLSNEGDGSALLAFKAKITQDPHNVLSSWNESIHFCEWYGVNCSRRHHQRVAKLDLQSQSLSGFIAPYIGNLSFLRELQLQNNSFSHEIPPEIGNLHRLQVLGLDYNSFTGSIPHNISHCFNLIILGLDRNRLVGKIPAEIGSLSKLQSLGLSENNLAGEIPPSLGNLSSLKILDASINHLVGSIPSSLGQLKKLKLFAIDGNKLSGTIPPSIYNLSSLLSFSVVLNQIRGSIPENLGKAFPNLETFNIPGNHFSGSIPLSVANISSLIWFDVGSNQLTGQVPNLRTLHTLQRFRIGFNHLGSGKDGDLSFLSDLTNATGLRELIMSKNNFGGTLPRSMSNLSTNLEQFWMGENQLYGSIPDVIGNLKSLETFSVRNNSFTGNIPPDIGKLTRLEYLDLSENELSGDIPSSLGNLTKLSKLFLSANNLEGSIPSSLGECHGLQFLDLSHNNLSGAIPATVIGLSSLSIYLDLSNNHFEGSLPMEVGKLESLTGLDVSNNMLSGKLPTTLGSCESLDILFLQGNFFSGSIPSSLSSLRGIQYLDLSRNNLSGELPSFLEGLILLKNLNLAFNDFLGSVPTGGVFKNSSAISVVGNGRLCGGIPNLQLPKCSSKRSPPNLKLIIPLVCGLALLGIAVGLTYFCICSYRKITKEISLNTSENFVMQVSYATLLKATGGFSVENLIGRGSFGSVYRGVFADDDGAVLVAVKVFNMLRPGAFKSFIAECEALRNIRHRNLVKIITACSSIDFQGNDFKALVYEFMDMGSLADWLHPTNGEEEVGDPASNSLSLLQRLRIIIDVACGLDYLHNHCETPIVHCDLKPSNILLDNDLTGHVSDFGLARFLPQLSSYDPSDHTSAIGVRGTVGYAAPEYGMGSAVSISGDIYSFGILLLEMFTGKRPTEDVFSGGLNLHGFVDMAFPDRVIEIADPLLLQVDSDDQRSTSNSHEHSSPPEKIEACLTAIFRIGICCSAESPVDRIQNISAVASELHSIRRILLH